MPQSLPEAEFHQTPNTEKRLKLVPDEDMKRDIGKTGIRHTIPSFPPESSGIAYWTSPNVFDNRANRPATKPDGTPNYIVL